MSDDALARALRDLDPARTPVDAPIPLDAERRLREILGREAPAPRRRGRRWTLTTAVAACAAVVLAVVVGIVWSPAPSASATTPEPLEYRPVSSSVADVVDTAQMRLDANAGPTSSERRSLTLGWYFSATLDDDTDDTVFRREWVETRWNPDLSGSVVTTVADATNAAGDTVPTGDATPGSLVSELPFIRGQYRPITVDPPQATPDAMEAIVRGATGDGTTDDTAVSTPAPLTADSVIIGARRLMSDWTLTDDQQSALLALFSEASGASVLGETEDRLGRPAVAIAGSTTVPPHHELALLISTETGRILGIEDVLLEDDADIPLPAGAVVEYILWDADAWKNGMR